MIKILIADDQELIRQSLMIILNSESNFEVTDAVTNGVEVIRSVRKERPDVILMDIRMPEMDGVVCTQIIKENYPDIKIIILTGYDDFDYARRGIKAGIFDYLMKPVRADELNATLKKAADEILKLRLQKAKQKKLLEEMERNIPALRDIYINRILLQERAEDDIEKELDKYGVKVNTGKDRGIKVGIIAIKESVSQLGLTEQIMEEAKSFYQSDDDIIVLRDHWNRIVAVTDSMDVPFEECMDILISIIQKKFHCHVSTGISEGYPGWNSIHSAYADALDDMKKKHGTRAGGAGAKETEFYGLWGELTESVKNGFAEESLEMVERIFSAPEPSFPEQQKKVMICCQKMA